MDTPTPVQVRERSRLLRARYPEPAAGGDESPDLLTAITDAAVLVATWTGRLIAPADVGEEVPAGLVPVALRAVARMAERVDEATASAEASKTAGGKRLRSISAGPWSESYFAPGELAMKNGVAAVTGDAVLDGLLWALMTEDAREQWFALTSGVQAPAGGVTSFDYRRMGGTAGLRLGSGPDGW